MSDTKESYSLLISKELVREANYWWKEPKNVSNDRICELLNISRNDQNTGFGLDFSEIRQGEILLKDVFSRINKYDIHSVETAVLLLDSIYHTRLQSPLRTARNIQELLKDDDLLNKINEAKEQKEIVDCVNKIASIDKEADKNNNYIYSFATKFCNRLNPECFPIFDSYVAGLLHRYKKKDGFANFTQASLGNYENFLNVYEKFREAYQLTEFNFKKIDIFMWTYGKILSSKNNKNQKDGIALSVQFYMTADEMQRIK